MRTLLFFSCVLMTSFICGGKANGAIVVDYTHDTTNFFGNATAKAALEAAVSDINMVLNLNLGAITNDMTNGVDGSFDFTFDFQYNYTNPTTGLSETIADTTLAANEVRLFVGAQSLGGTTLGQGGPGVTNSGSGGSFVGGGSGTIAGAIANAVTNDQHGRGDGPVINTVNGNVGGVPYSFDAGLTTGNLWFDNDTDNMGGADSTAILEASWHFDHTTAVASGKNDFYSVALHEVLHAVGVGGSDTWNSLVSGTDFTGANVIALNGTGTNIIDGGGAHFEAGLMSTRISDGMAQEVVMDPNITTGTRKYLTFLDVAVLQDIGFANASASAVPEPSSVLLIAAISCFGVIRRRRHAAIAA